MEIELKLHLEGPAEAEALASFLGAERERLQQENVYFDTLGAAMASLGMAVRLRRENERVLLTVKSAGEERGEFMERGEWEVQLPRSRWTELARGGSALREEALAIVDEEPRRSMEAAMHDGLLVPVGSMQNHRRRFALDDSRATPLVELDRTVYPDGSVVFEVELEVDDLRGAAQARERLRAAFERAGIPWRPTSLSKRERLERVLGVAHSEPEDPEREKGR
jgi:inorganic triphosphatase YgiF